MSAIFIRLVVLIAVFVTIFLLSQWFVQGYLNRRAETKAVNRRMELLKSGVSMGDIDEILRKGVPSRLDPEADIFARAYHRFRQAVTIAQVGMAPRTILLVCITGFAIVGALILLLAWSSGSRITIGTIELTIGLSAGLTMVLPWLFIMRRKEKRRKRMEEQFPVALDVFTRALKAGHPIGSAIDLLTREMEDPLGSEFGLVADEVAYGADLTNSLMDLADRWDLSDIRMFAVAISLQSETGGNLAEILGNLSSVIRDRHSMFLKVRALSSEGRMSGWMLSVLPVATFLLLFLLNSQFYFEVAGDPIFTYGFTGLGIMYLIGVMTIRRLIDLKV
jgi:tight adherence protein B